jgi:hypothetical protein
VAHGAVDAYAKPAVEATPLQARFGLQTPPALLRGMGELQAAVARRWATGLAAPKRRAIG